MVPQSRKRLYFVASRSDMDIDLEIVSRVVQHLKSPNDFHYDIDKYLLQDGDPQIERLNEPPPGRARKQLKTVKVGVQWPTMHREAYDAAGRVWGQSKWSADLQDLCPDQLLPTLSHVAT